MGHRDFVYVGDVVHAWIAALEHGESSGEIVNIGSGIETTVNELCNQVLSSFERSRSNLTVKYHSRQEGDIRNSAADISLAKRMLGWSPDIDLPRGLAKTIAWAKSKSEHTY